MIRVALVIIAIVLGTAACTSASTGTASLDAVPVPAISHWQIEPGQFISLRYGQKGAQFVALSDMSTGALVRDLLPATAANGMQVTGLALDHADDLWITYSKGPSIGGPAISSGPAIPEPDTCANQVDVVQAGTGRVTVALRTSDNVLIWAAQPSPDGRELAYRESACTAYQDTYLRIDNLFSKQQWSIGQGLPDCHLLAGVAWSTNGRTLLADYGPASQPYSYGSGSDTCAEWWAGRLVRVNAGTAQRGLAGTTTLAAPGCQIDAVAGTAGGGALAVEGCGGAPDFTSGQVSLLVIGADGHLDRRLTLGACVDGAGIAVNQAGTAALVSAYFTCAPSGQATKAWEYHAGTLRLVLSEPGNGGSPIMAAWRSLTGAGWSWIV
jgi:hypothetical protein